MIPGTEEAVVPVARALATTGAYGQDAALEHAAVVAIEAAAPYILAAAEDRFRGREDGHASARDYDFAERIFAGWRVRAEEAERKLAAERERLWREVEPLLRKVVDDLTDLSFPDAANLPSLAALRALLAPGTEQTSTSRSGGADSAPGLGEHRGAFAAEPGTERERDGSAPDEGRPGRIPPTSLAPGDNDG